MHRIPDPDPQHWLGHKKKIAKFVIRTFTQGFGSGSRRAKMTPEKDRISSFEVPDVLF
jgi:hypothetical protein